MPERTEVETGRETEARTHAEITLLASNLIWAFGTAEGNTRTLAWETADGIAHCLTRADDSQWLTQQAEYAGNNWLHIANDNGEHDTIELSDAELAGLPADQLARVRDGLQQGAAQRLLAMAERRLNGRARFAVRYAGTNVEVMNFLNAEHEPFVWIRAGEVAYDLTPNELRVTDPRLAASKPRMPVGPEQSLNWMFSALAEVSEERLEFQGYRIPMYDQKETQQGDLINKAMADELHYYSDDIMGWRNPNLQLKVKPGAVTARAMYNTRLYSSAPGHEDITVVFGMHTEGNVMHVEVVDLTSDGRRKLVVDVDFAAGAASGITQTADSYKRVQGMDAAHHVRDFVQKLERAYTHGGLKQCPPDALAMFEHAALKPDSVE